MNRIPIRSSHKPVPAFTWLALLGRDPPEAAARFRRWRGASGKTYLVSVYPIAACPDYVDAVLIAVDGRNGACVWIGEAGPDLQCTLAALVRAGADELHVHLLAGDGAARAAVIRDLDGRH